jgi:hypothetical protein
VSDPLILKLLEAKDEAARRGLWTTMHKIDSALQRLGWELAGHKTETRYEKVRNG